MAVLDTTLLAIAALVIMLGLQPLFDKETRSNSAKIASSVVLVLSGVYLGYLYQRLQKL